MPPFSRMQLAAALIEYDNDPDDPDAPYRSAEDSAIFSFLRKRNNPRNTIMGYDEMPRQPVDFLKVAVPGEGEDEELRRAEPSIYSHNAHKSQDFRHSVEPLARPSSEMVKLNESMFRDGIDDEDEIEMDDTPPLNLASWGVDNFLAKEQPRPRSRASSINALNRAASPGPSMRPCLTSTTSSNAMHAAVAQERGENRRSAGYRARSLGRLDLFSNGDVDEHGMAFLSSAHPRPSSVADPADLAARNQYPPDAFRNRYSSISGMQPIPFPSGGPPEAEPNPFELPPPSPAHTSRFDPKSLAHQRTTSFASMSTRYMEGEGRNIGDNASIMTGPLRQDGPHRYSHSNLLRPKVLVMPQLLQDQEPVAQGPKRSVREGYLDSTDSRPLPPGAKTARLSTYGSAMGLNQRSSMTLSQITFRNSLMVGGQRDPSFADLEVHIKRAENEGEMVEQEAEPEPEPIEEDNVPRRAAGKLYGRSLIDDLEARKAQLKNRQRVFRGDERPSMMQRPQMQRSETLITMEDLQRRSQMPQLRSTVSQGQLLDMDDEPIPGTNIRARPQMGRTSSGLPQSRSVFGVDQVWERELAKLQQIEAMEKAENEERRKIEAEKRKREEGKAAKKAAKKGKAKDTLNVYAAPNEGMAPLPEEQIPIQRTSATPPLLPAVNPFPMPAKADESSSESNSDFEPNPRKRQRRMQRPASRQDWLSDDERQAIPRPRPQQVSRGLADGLRMDDSDDEDLPLTTALAKAKAKQQAEDSEEDKPLAAVLNKAISTFDFGGTILADIGKTQDKSRTPKADDSDDDDKPLALQHTGARQTMFARADNGDLDDEQPLGMRFSAAPSQIFMQQQQQQQQQMMMQQQMMAAAQMRGSMFNPMFMAGMNGMGGGMHGMGMGFPNSMSMPALNTGMMPMPPIPIADPGVVPDAAKLGRVDRWRRDVGGMADG